MVDPHPRIAARRRQGPVRVADQHSARSAVDRFNARLAVAVTRVVGTMWCAYAFGAWDLLSLPAAWHQGIQGLVSWVAQTFLQLVLLSVIMVGQNVQAAAADKRSEQMYHDIEALLDGQHKTDLALAATHDRLDAIHERLNGIEPGGGGS